MVCVKVDLFSKSAQKASGCILVIILLPMPRNHGHTGSYAEALECFLS